MFQFQEKQRVELFGTELGDVCFHEHQAAHEYKVHETDGQSWAKIHFHTQH